MGDARDSHRTMHQVARANGRTLIIDGVEWRVYELPPGTYDRRGAASLVFETHDVFRRIRGFPPNWRSLDDEALFAVSLGR
jgi:hypothetical protein